MRLVIIGAGPCGLGAAWRLNELHCPDWTVFEQSNQVGGLSASFTDEQGYTWDIGGHVLFSHYDYFDDVLARIMPQSTDWFFHERESWVRVQKRWVPYPIQMNIHHLKSESFIACVKGLIHLLKSPLDKPPKTFADWIDASFGHGLAEVFLRPYNWKVWGYPLDRMPWHWVGERVATIDLERIIENYVYKRDDIAWGPNRTFRFPAFGGTGAIWINLMQSLPQERIALNEECIRIDLDSRRLHFKSGLTREYDTLLSTMPLTRLCQAAGISDKFSEVHDLGVSSTHVVGIGLSRTDNNDLGTKCWMYFPEDNCPFYRVTNFSHYSRNNVPDSHKYWSLMVEVCETRYKPVSAEAVVEDVIQGLVNAGLIHKRSSIVNVWYRRFSDTYPVPTLERDETVGPILEYLEARGVYSRGRMGAWKYEVGNMDHSFMQGKEWADKVINGNKEITLYHPEIVNAPKQQSN